MQDTTPDLEQRLAARLRQLRAERGLSLEALASRSGVSRSMISLIERAESSPTAAVLAKLAASLGETLASLFDPPGEAPAARGPIARAADQQEWKDPASGYVRRNVSPSGTGQPMQIVEVRFPPGARVAFENGGGARIHQQVWLLEGTMVVTVGKVQHRLERGDCLAMRLDEPTMFHNPARKAARYAVVLSAPGAGA